MSSIPLTDKLVKEIADFRLFCEKQFGKVGDFVFVTNKKKKLSADSVKCIFKKLKTIMDFKDVRLSCHTFRHTFAHRMCMNGCDVFTLQKMLRHTEIEMTSRYISMWGLEWLFKEKLIGGKRIMKRSEIQKIYSNIETRGFTVIEGYVSETAVYSKVLHIATSHTYDLN